MDIIHWPQFEAIPPMTEWKVEMRKIGSHYIIKAGCEQVIIHNKEEALRWLGKMWDEHVEPKK